MSIIQKMTPRSFVAVERELRLLGTEPTLDHCRYCYRRGHTHGRIAATEQHMGPLMAQLDRLEVELKRIRRAMERGES